VREVTLLGQIVNLYGRHEFEKIDGKSPFVQLIEAVHAVDGIDRIRFTSPHPIGFRPDLVECFERLPKLMPHVHLPLQSGSDRLLKQMHRGYTAAKYLSLTEAIRRARPDIALTTDVIVGFPGETDEDYALTRKLVEQVGFDNAFIFRYSQRKDTPAVSLPNQVSEEIKEARNQDLLSVIDDLAKTKSEALVGQLVEVLCEGPSKTNPERLSGRTPGNKVVVMEGGERHIGQIFNVKITRSTGFTLYGDPAVL